MKQVRTYDGEWISEPVDKNTILSWKTLGSGYPRVCFPYLNHEN